MGLWVIALSWSAGQLTDGFIPDVMLPALGGRAVDAKALVQAGLWEVVDGGWIFHDFADYNPSRKDFEDRQERDRNRKAAAREALRVKRQSERNEVGR